MILDCISKTEIAAGAVTAISSKASLAWAGLSEDFSLIVMDSEGMVSMLGSNVGWQWSPILDTNTKKKDKEDNFWPTSVKEGKLIVVPLKGDEYPEVKATRPITSVLPFRMPLGRTLGSAASDELLTLEEFSMRARTALKQKDMIRDFLVEDENKQPDDLDDEFSKLCGQLDKVTLKLYVGALQSNKVEKAVDFASKLMLEGSFSICLQLADRSDLQSSVKMALCERIEYERDVKFPPLEESGYDDEEAVQEQQWAGARSLPPHISPTTPATGSKRPLAHEEHDDDEEQEFEQQGNVEELENVAANAAVVTKKSVNPFKKSVVSPAKKKKMGFDAILSPSPAKMSQPELSRSSTFSANSRQKVKSAKRVL